MLGVFDLVLIIFDSSQFCFVVMVVAIFVVVVAVVICFGFRSYAPRPVGFLRSDCVAFFDFHGK